MKGPRKQGSHRAQDREPDKREIREGCIDTELPESHRAFPWPSVHGRKPSEGGKRTMEKDEKERDPATHTGLGSMPFHLGNWKMSIQGNPE